MPAPSKGGKPTPEAAKPPKPALVPCRVLQHSYLLCSRAGLAPQGNQCQPGDAIDMSDDEAAAALDKGLVELI